MSLYKLETTQKLPISITEAWEFFSSPKNLKEITPSYMGFVIKNELEIRKMYSGQIIEYKVSPIFNIPITWVTEITHVAHLRYFVDEQRFGPYSLWHHKHFFEEINGGILMTDIVHYKLPLGILGDVAHWLFVKKQLKEIFSHRYKVLENRFGTMK